MKNGKWRRANEQYIAAITESIRKGVPARHAARAAGISEATFYQWKTSYPEFLEAIEKAESEAVQINVATVQKAAKRQWQAAAWWLERRHKDEFALRQEISGELDLNHHDVKDPSALQSALSSLGLVRVTGSGDKGKE